MRKKLCMYTMYTLATLRKEVVINYEYYNTSEMRRVNIGDLR